MKAQVYKDPRPAEHFARFHTRTRTRRPDWVYELVRVRAWKRSKCSAGRGSLYTCAFIPPPFYPIRSASLLAARARARCQPASSVSRSSSDIEGS